MSTPINHISSTSIYYLFQEALTLVSYVVPALRANHFKYRARRGFKPPIITISSLVSGLITSSRAAHRTRKSIPDTTSRIRLVGCHKSPGSTAIIKASKKRSEKPSGYLCGKAFQRKDSINPPESILEIPSAKSERAAPY